MNTHLNGHDHGPRPCVERDELLRERLREALELSGSSNPEDQAQVRDLIRDSLRVLDR